MIFVSGDQDVGHPCGRGSISAETAPGADRLRMNPQSDNKNALKRVGGVRNLFQQIWPYQASISIDAGLAGYGDFATAPSQSRKHLAKSTDLCYNN